MAVAIGIETTIGKDPETDKERDPEIEPANAVHHTSLIAVTKAEKNPVLSLGSPLKALTTM